MLWFRLTSWLAVLAIGVAGVAGLAGPVLAIDTVPGMPPVVDPNLVRANRLRVGEGVHGDPARANPQLGQLGVDLIVTRTVEVIRKAVARR